MFFFLLICILTFDSIAQTIVSHHFSECDSRTIPTFIKNRIISKEIINDTLHLSIGFTENCCAVLTPKLSWHNDTLRLGIVDSSEEWCACNCCFELNLKVVGIKDTNFILKHRNQVLLAGKNKTIFPLESEIDTIQCYNQVNQEGKNIGLWIYYFENTTVVRSKVYYSQNGDLLWRFIYDQAGNLSNVEALTKNRHLTSIEGKEYYELIGK